MPPSIYSEVTGASADVQTSEHKAGFNDKLYI